VSEKTLDSYADTVRLHITPSLGRKALRKLTVADVDQLLAWKRDAGYSTNTVRIIRAVLRSALKQAERKGFGFAECSRTLRRTARSERRRSSHLGRPGTSPAGAGTKLARGAVADRDLAFGLRRGEALSLHWSALDWEWDTPASPSLKMFTGISWRARNGPLPLGCPRRR
jgi:integrase